MKRVVARHIAVDHIFGAPFCARRNNNTNLKNIPRRVDLQALSLRKRKKKTRLLRSRLFYRYNDTSGVCAAPPFARRLIGIRIDRRRF